MVRMTFPDCDVLDRVDLDESPLPNGPPCWFPGTVARVLYAGGDGRLYRLDFETTRPHGLTEDVAEIRPRALAWRTPIPADGKARIDDVSWPADVRLGGRLLVSWYLQDGKCENDLTSQLGWLMLDRGGTSIIASGPLLQPDSSDAPEHRRLPTLVRSSDGAPALAYLAKFPQQSGYQLRVVPVRFDPDSNVPYAIESEARVLATGCSLVAPAVSLDGRWVTVVRQVGAFARSERIAIESDEKLAMRLP
jgi:hypothetical protein